MAAFTGGGPPDDRRRRRRRRRRRGEPPRKIGPPVRQRRRPRGGGKPGPGQGFTTPDADRVSASVATPGNEGTEEFDGSGDLTGTDEMQAVYSQGQGNVPQLHYGRNEAFQHEQAAAVSSASEEGESG